MAKTLEDSDDPRQLVRYGRSLGDRFKVEAKARRVSADLIRKQYVFAIFLQRLFSDDSGQWLLLGGNALIVRTGGGRFTQDIDLARSASWVDPETVLEELQAAVGVESEFYRFRFDLHAITPHNSADQFGYGTATAKVKVRVYLGVKLFDTFNIDLTSRRQVYGEVDRVPLRAIIEDESLKGLPAVPVVPIENHLVDKLCAMYEVHGGNPSTRYRDLADVVRIVQQLEFRADRLAELLVHETLRRKMDSITEVRIPAESWRANFPKAAEGFAEYPTDLWSLDASLDIARGCLDEVLSGQRPSGVWAPELQSWMDD